MRIATLFSGIGAPEQGAMRVYGDKLETVFACEFDKFARQSYEANYDIAPEHFHKDVNDLDATQYKGKVDILIGGSPCQAFSIAGLRNGTDDERGQLIYQYIRVVEECRPEVIVYENVKGMMSITGGRTIKEFVQALRDIGYYCHYDVINTKDYGVPQNRERLFLVGFLDHEAYHRFEFAPKIPLEKRLKDVLESDVDEKYYLSDKVIAGNIVHKERHSERGNGFAFEPKTENDICGCLATKYGNRQTDTYLLEPKIIDFTNDFGEDNYREYSDYSPSLRSERFGLGVQEPKIEVIGSTGGGNEMNSRIYSQDGIAPTLNAGNNGGGQSPVKNLTDDNRIRKLTPRECLRLQDFPDTFKIEVSDSQAYKQAGNSMSVNILEMIFNQIEKAKSNEPTNTLMDFIGETA